MDEVESTVEAREESMRVQLAGDSSAVTAAEAAAGLAGARREFEAERGTRYGIGFGYVKNFGSPRGLDGIRLEYAVTDGERVANVHVIISGTRLATLGSRRGVDEVDERLRAWAFDRLYELAGRIEHGRDRYATLLRHHPLRLV